MIDVYEEAKKKYPKPWNKAMLKRLVNLGKLTEAEYEEIVGEPFPG